MGLETGTYINSLNSANPAATDALSQADEHLRLIKSTVKATFPSVTGAITGTHTAINAKVAEPVSAITSDGSAPSLNTAAGVTAANLKALLGVDGVAITTATDGSGNVTPSLGTGINALDIWNLVKASALNSIYPIGAIYTAITSGSPATVFGGTWVSFGQGRVLVGHDDAAEPDTDFVASSTDGSSVLVGGAKTHTLSIAEIPSHTHGFTAHLTTSGDNDRGGGGVLTSSQSGTTAATGGGQAHNIIQPYVVVYMWRRTA
tara:strand:+ start:185 stop:967 length:783 start_codon:yes stop_codon:yes gene_type:complete